MPTIEKRYLKFEEGDKVYLKNLQMKKVVRDEKKGKSSPRYLGPYEILQKIGKVAYDLKLPSKFVPVEILYRQVMKLRNKEVASVKVLWKNNQVKGATWEAEADMKSYYAHLFDN